MSTPLPPLATPASAEAQRTELGKALEAYLTPLVDYCNRQPDDDNLSLADFQHGYAIREALAAIARYDAQTEQLLEHYRASLLAGQQLAQAQVPSLEQAIQQAPTPEELLAERELEPLYRLGFVRGHRRGVAQTEARYEPLLRLYAQHAVLPAPANHTPSPLLARLEKLLASPELQPYQTESIADRLTASPTPLPDGPESR